MPHHIGADVGKGILERVAHPRLGGQVDDLGDLRELAGQGEHCVAVLHVEAAEGEAVAPAEAGEPRLLQGRIVITVQVIDTDYTAAPLHKLLCNMEADEASGAGDQDAHGRPARSRRPPPLNSRCTIAFPRLDGAFARPAVRSEEHTSELQSLMRISYAVFCLNKKNI